MTNKYLTKIAANRYEAYLENKPADATFSDPRIQRAHKYVHEAKIERGMADVLAETGAIDAANKHVEKAEAAVRKNRKGVMNKRVAVHSPFANTGDELLRRKKGVVLRADNKKINASANHVKLTGAGKVGNPQKLTLSQHIAKYFKKHPVKGTMMASGALLGAGLVGYGLHKETKK